MTLFDGEPLTENDVASRELCRCGDARHQHPDDGPCLHDCDCEEFEEV